MSLIHDDSLMYWINGILQDRPHSAGPFLKYIARAAVIADQSQYTMLRSTLMELKHKYPEFYYKEPQNDRPSRIKRP